MIIRIYAKRCVKLESLWHFAIFLVMFNYIFVESSSSQSDYETEIILETCYGVRSSPEDSMELVPEIEGSN